MRALTTISGKGGVGKTLVASTIIQGLIGTGRTVGAIDADFSNPNLGRMLKVSGEIAIRDDKKMVPVKATNGQLSFFSIETFAKDRGVFMTGEEYAEIIKDAVKNGVWDVEYMVVDLPAAVGSEFKSVLEIFENDYIGSVIVSQPSHLPTTERVVKLHQINGIPVLGLVENMVGFTCTTCNTQYPVFGESGIDSLAAQYKIPVLGKVPVSMEVQRDVKEGEAVVIPDSAIVSKVVETVLAARPQRLGFVEELKAKMKQVTRDTAYKLILDSLGVIKTNVNIPGLMQKNHFPGGQTIGLVVMDEKWQNEIIRKFFRITKAGQIGLLKDEDITSPNDVGVWLQIKGIALGWALIGQKKFPDGRRVPYDLMDAWLNGDARVYGDSSVVKAISFYRDVWGEAKDKVAPKLLPVIEALV
jgi:ATP-binding protein involved in chromosome partitioning